MLLAEDLLLLLTDDESGKREVDTTRLDLALAGAVVLDLVELGRLDVTGSQEGEKEGRLVVRDAALTDHPVLNTALERVEKHRPQKPAQTLRQLTKGLRTSVYVSLEARGVLHHERARVLGVVPTRTWPAVDSTHEAEVRQALHDVLVVGRTPDRREVLLISLLQAVDQLPKVLGVSGAEKKQVRSRGKELAEGELGGEAVARAVMEVRAAVTAAVAAAAAATASGG
jgi:hypothetical protein